MRSVDDLLDPHIIVMESLIDESDVALLTPAEGASVRHAVDKRKCEFATGRRVARVALARLGFRDVELLVGADRAPVWPPGVCGSISHNRHRVVVAVTPAAHGTVGVDVETGGELAQELWRSVLLPHEIDALEGACPAPERGRMALVAFSAKEAVYKAQFAQTRAYMEFHDVSVQIAPDPLCPNRGSLRFTFEVDVRGGGRRGFARGAQAHGRYHVNARGRDDVMTGVRIPLEPARW